jgi:GNAT superfamily N-acetyltransferase
MRLTFSLATEADAAALAALHAAVADDLTRRYGPGSWSFQPAEKALLHELSRPKFARMLVARSGERIVGTLKLATKKPWAIDAVYFSPVEKPLYLTGMSVEPVLQRCGIGRSLLREAESLARNWPGDAIRLDAFAGDAGAGGFYTKCGYREVARVTYRTSPLIYFEMLL